MHLILSRLHNCKFYGLVRIGKLEPFYLEFKKISAARWDYTTVQSLVAILAIMW